MVNRRIITFPHIGKEYTKIIKESFENLGMNIQLPPKTTDKTIKLGVKNSADMICYPYKVTLGNFIEALDKGANTLLMYDTRGTCRFRHYHKVQDFTLKNMGYNDFEMYGISGYNVVPILRKLSGKSTIRVIRELGNLIKNIRRYDAKRVWSDEKPNIGIIGELYSAIDPTINFGLEEKIKSYGTNPYNAVTISNFLNQSLLRYINPFHKRKDKNKIRAESYFNGKVGGHAVENIHELFNLIDKDVDGIIHILPLSCFLGDTLITTNNFKSKKIKEIKKNDKILTHKGRFKKVTEIIKRKYNGDIYDISCGGILKFKITPEHPVFALKRNFVKSGKRVEKSPEFIKIKDLNKNDFIAIPKPKESTSKEYFKSDMINNKKPKYQDLKRFNYNKGMLRLLGYYLAEGCVQYDRNKKKSRKYISGVRFTFNKKENLFMNDIIKILEENKVDCYCKIYLSEKRPNTADLSLSNRSIGYLLKKLGGRYCDKKIIHKDIMNLPRELQLEVAKGFFRGDGCFTENKVETTYRAVTTSFDLAEQLFWILIKNNIKCTIMEQNIKNRKRSWMIKISNVESIKRMKDDLIKPKIKINNVRFLEMKNYFLIPIRKIKKEKFEGNVYNLEVEEDNSYVANFLAVHNCMPETLGEPMINKICVDNRIPLLRIPIDENNSNANLETRIETFCELIKLRKKEESKGCKNLLPDRLHRSLL